MRIKCSSFEAFLANIKNQSLYNHTIFVDKHTEPVGGNPRDAIVFHVIMHLTGIIDYSDGGQALLDCAIDCGLDRHDEDVLEASLFYDSCFVKLESYCDEYGLMVKPGIVDM